MTDHARLNPAIRNAEPGAWLMVASSAAGFLATIIYYFWRGDGIAYTGGTLLVIVTTGLLLGAALVMTTTLARNWWVAAFLNVSTGLDILGTGFAAWLLEAHWLLGLILLAAVGWIIHVVYDGQTMQTVRQPSPRLKESVR